MFPKYVRICFKFHWYFIVIRNHAATAQCAVYGSISLIKILRQNKQTPREKINRKKNETKRKQAKRQKVCNNDGLNTSSLTCASY